MKGKTDWTAAVWSGLIAGLVFIVVEMMLVGITGAGSPWGPPRMIGAIGLGPGVLPPPATFDLGIFIVALVIHFALSAILGLLFGWTVARWRWGLLATTAAGAVFGLLVYLVNFYGFTAIFPWFADARSPITVFAHIVFGLVLGWSAARNFAK
jgi:hypothetical protein